MADIPLNQIVRLAAWHITEVDGGAPFGTCVTAMDAATTLKLMKVADAAYLAKTPGPLQTSNPQDQLFILVRAAGGFRIVKYGTTTCLDVGDWFFNKPFNVNEAPTRTAVRHLLLKQIDPTASSQVFAAEKGKGFDSINAFKLFCIVDGQRYDLAGNDYAAKEWVLLTLAKGPGTPSYDLFAIQPQQGSSPTIHVEVYNQMADSTRFRVCWAGGNTPGVGVQASNRAVLTLDGVTPPPGTSCWIKAEVSRGAMDAGTYESSDNFTVGPAVNDPFVRYTLSRHRNLSVGFDCEFFG